MKKLLIVLSAIGGIALSQGCGLFGDHCKVDESSCDGKQITTCEGLEDGETYSSTYDCPPEQQCVSLGKHQADCVTQDVGGSCKTDLGCHPELRCVGGFCAGPSPTAVTACNAAPFVSVPNDGTTLRATVTIDQSDPVFAELLLRTVLTTENAPVPNVTRYGFLRLDASANWTSIRPVAADPQIFKIVGTTCAKLFDAADLDIETQPTDPAPVAVVVLNEGSTATTVSVDLSRE